MTGDVRTLYRLKRRGDRWLPARAALGVARMIAAVPGRWAPGEAITWSEGGWTYTATLHYDDDADTSWLGEFTDDDDEGTIPYPGATSRTFQRFRPANPGAAEYPYYRRSGMGRAEARERCADLDERAMLLAADPELYGVTVKAEHPYYGSGEMSLWGIDDEACAWDAARGDVASEARADAERSAGKRLARLTGYPSAIVDGAA